jgi:hypothetical protein
VRKGRSKNPLALSGERFSSNSPTAPIAEPTSEQVDIDIEQVQDTVAAPPTTLEAEPVKPSPDAQSA